MGIRIAGLFSLLALIAPLPQDDVALTAAKDATVHLFWSYQSDKDFIYCDGFVFRKEGDSVLIATSAILVSLNGYRVNEGEVIFHTKGGEPRRLRGEVVGMDLAKSMAIVRVKGTGLPEPLAFADLTTVKETQPAYVVGHQSDKDNPKKFLVTSRKASISSIRKLDTGELAVLQLDSNLPSDFLGGPVLDGSGKVLGMGGFTVGGTGISFVIPHSHLQRMIAGYGSTTYREVVENKEGTYRISLRTHLVDPLKRIASISYLASPIDLLKADPKRLTLEEWEAIGPNPQEVSLKIGDEMASGEIVLKARGRAAEKYVFQTRWKRQDGTVGHSEPETLLLDFLAGMAPSYKKPGSDDWIGVETTPRPLSSDVGAVSEGKTEYAGVPQDLADVVLTPLKTESNRFARCMSWSSDGQSFWALEIAGVLRRINAATLREEKVFTVGKQCSFVGVSKAGLVLLVKELQEIWVLDEATLALRRKIAVAGSSYVGVSPGSSIGFATEPTASRVPIFIVDLEAGKILSFISPDKYSNPNLEVRKPKGTQLVFSDWGYPEPTPDRKFLFTICGDSPRRFKILANDLIMEEAGYGQCANGRRLLFSQDGLTLVTAVPVKTEKTQVPGVVWYRTADLQQPVASLALGKYVMAGCLTASGSRGAFLTENRSLVVARPTGEKEIEVQLGGNHPGLPSMIINPAGKQIVLLDQTGFYRIELKK